MRFQPEYCMNLLLESGFQAYYAFETARDLLINQKPGKIIIYTNADLAALYRLFPDVKFKNNREENAFLQHNEYTVHFIVGDNDANVVRIPGIPVDYVASLKSLAQQTLFVTNAFFYDPYYQKFYDPLDIYWLLKKEIITTYLPPPVAAKRYPTIALKTAKVFGETGFMIGKTLQKFLDEEAPHSVYYNVDAIIAHDFFDILVAKRVYEAMMLLDTWGILELILPEVTRLKTVRQDKDHHPEGNGFWHTLQCLRYVKRPTRNLMMAVLLHDIGKAETQNNRRNGPPFPNHAKASRRIAKDVLSRFTIANDDRDEILFLVENHMILNAVNVLPENKLRALFTSPYIQSLFELYRADIASGYHGMERYYLATRTFKSVLHHMKLQKQGMYL